MSRSKALRLARKLHALAHDRAVSSGEKEQATRRCRDLMMRFGFDERDLVPEPTPAVEWRMPASGWATGYARATSGTGTVSHGFTVSGGRITWWNA